MIYVNGRFLARNVTGVERFATELIRAIDESESAPDWCLLAPRQIARPGWLRRMRFRSTGRLRGHAWEQIDLPAAARGGVLLNLCNSGPIAHPRSLVVLHDAWVFRYPEHFSRPYRLFHRALDRILARRGRIATVSDFSRRELSAVLRLDEKTIVTIPNAADHLDRIIPNRKVLDRLGLDRAPYLLMVGSFAPNKNMPAAIRAFLNCAKPAERLVIVGAKVGSFANDELKDLPGNVILAGRVDDDELTALYAGARALAFPSIYEGFGIPPLEAMHFGKAVLASDIPVSREVCGDAALYFDPRISKEISDSIRNIFDDETLHGRLCEAARQRATHYSWQVSANRLSKIADTI